MGISERRKEIKRRRHRLKKMRHWKERLPKASMSEKEMIVAKIRALTPGGEAVIGRLGLEER